MADVAVFTLEEMNQQQKYVRVWWEEACKQAGIVARVKGVVWCWHHLQTAEESMQRIETILRESGELGGNNGQERMA